MKVKDLATIQANYSGAAGTAQARYAAAVPGIQWQAKATDGQALYIAKMQDPATLDRRKSGIAKVSDADFRKAVQDKGVSVLSSRMQAAAPKQAAKYAPFKAALEAVTLPAKSIDAGVNIDMRLKPVVAALQAAKKAQG